VVCGADGVAVFDALHKRGTVTEAMLYAFDLIELDGNDFRPLSLGERKAKLARLLAREPLGIAYNDHTDKDGAAVFQQACKMGLEGIVSKRLAAPTDRDRRVIGSRSRTRTARPCSGHVRAGGKKGCRSVGGNWNPENLAIWSRRHLPAPSVVDAALLACVCWRWRSSQFLLSSC
jgi:ATP dependent DNA ligase-like protein